MLCCCMAALSLAAAEPACPSAWPAWQSFKSRFISDDGRVIDGGTSRKQTVSEAQAYAMFFALLDNDRKTFDKVLEWTQNNLAAGDLTARLPAWAWGHKADDKWDVIDKNSALDADLWMVYALGEAGRLWSEPRYAALASSLTERILREESADLPGLSPTLLPAPHGFKMSDKSWRLNPSYLPMQLLDWLSSQHPDPVWQKLAAS